MTRVRYALEGLYFFHGLILYFLTPVIAVVALATRTWWLLVVLLGVVVYLAWFHARNARARNARAPRGR